MDLTGNRIIIKTEGYHDDDRTVTVETSENPTCNGNDENYLFLDEGCPLLISDSKEMLLHDNGLVVKNEVDHHQLSEYALDVPFEDPLFIPDVKQETENPHDDVVISNGLKMEVDIGETIQWLKDEAPDIGLEEEKVEVSDKEMEGFDFQGPDEESDEDDPEFDPKEKVEKTSYFKRGTRLNKNLKENKTETAYHHAVIGKGLHLCKLCLDSKPGVLLKFKSVEALNEHILAVHEKKCTFNCEVCGRVYLKKEALMTHVRLTAKCKEGREGKNPDATTSAFETTVPKHGVVKSEVTQSGEKWACFCGKSYSLASSLRGHIRQVQRKENGVRDKCNFCSKTFSRSEDLRSHVESAHQGKTMSCPKCGMVFKHKKSLSRHLRLRCKAS